MSRFGWVVLFGIAACGDNDGEVGSGVENPPRDQYEEWIKIEPPGALCGNNSQYKIFANFSA
jgi:hypothetical protein